MKTDILLAIAKVVRETPDKEFDMDHWACGTTGCAIGRGIMQGVVPGLELTAVKLNGMLARAHIFPHVVGGKDYDWNSNDNEDFGFAAVAKVLGISRENADWLFSLDEYDCFRVQDDEDSFCYERPLQELVAERIEKFVARAAADGSDA